MKKPIHVVNWDHIRKMNAAAADSFEQVYRGIIRSLQSNGFTIHVLMREARGNTMDCLWKKEYSIIADGGNFRRKVEGIFSKTFDPPIYESVPERKELSSLSEDFVGLWCKPFSNGCGESTWREIWVSGRDGRAYELTIKKIPKPPLTGDYSNRHGFTTTVAKDYQCYVECFFTPHSEYDELKAVSSASQESEKKEKQTIDPALIQPIMGLKLRDLRHSTSTRTPDIMLFSEEKIRELTEEFFSGKAGESMSARQKNDAMTEMIKYVQCWRRSQCDRRVNCDATSCGSGYLCHTFSEWEVHCYDGGNCGTDIANRKVSISLLDTTWEEQEVRCLKIYRSLLDRTGEPEERVRKIKESWEYDGTLKREDCQVLLCGRSSLILLNPFGIEGIVKVSLEGIN